MLKGEQQETSLMAYVQQEDQQDEEPPQGKEEVQLVEISKSLTRSHLNNYVSVFTLRQGGSYVAVTSTN